MSLIRQIASGRRWKLLLIGAMFSAAYLAATATANADMMTYNLTPYTFPDLNNVDGGGNHYTDFVTGTITVTNTAGSVFNAYVAGDASLANVSLTSTLTMSTNDPGVVPVTVTGSAGLGADAPPDSNKLFSGSLTASPAGLFLSQDGYLAINYENGTSFPAYISGEIDPHDDGGAVSLFANPGNFNFGAETMQIFPQNLDATYGIGGPSGPWQIASAVPEPATLMLMGAALLGLGGALSIRSRRGLKN